MPHGRISLNLVLLLLVLEFCDWIQVGIDVYIPHRKYQVNFHSSSWFSVAYTAAIVIENIFLFANKINLLDLKYSSGSLVIVVKGS